MFRDREPTNPLDRLPGMRPRAARAPLETKRSAPMWMRIVGATAVLVSAAVHLYLWFDGFRDLHVVGPAFMLNAIGGLVIAVLLVTWRSWVPALLTAGFGVSTLVAFILAATVGLFGLHEQW